TGVLVAWSEEVDDADEHTAQDQGGCERDERPEPQGSAEQQPHEKSARRGGREHGTELLTPDRGCERDQRHSEDRGRDLKTPWCLQPPGEEAGEDDRRCRELGEREVPETGEADADGRRVAEDAVELGTGGGERVGDVEKHQGCEREHQWIERGSPSG